MTFLNPNLIRKVCMWRTQRDFSALRSQSLSGYPSNHINKYEANRLHIKILLVKIFFLEREGPHQIWASFDQIPCCFWILFCYKTALERGYMRLDQLITCRDKDQSTIAKEKEKLTKRVCRSGASWWEIILISKSV